MSIILFLKKTYAITQNELYLEEETNASNVTDSFFWSPCKVAALKEHWQENSGIVL